MQSEAKAFDPDGVVAILFDVQGTLVDFHATILREGGRLAAARGLAVDWAPIVDAWRAAYRRGLDAVIAGSIVWRSTDRIYREALDTILADYDWGPQLSAEDRDRLNAVWSRLEPWPDTRAGLERLRTKYTLATLSNGSMASVIGIARHGRLPFDCILTAELVRSSKPDPKVYALAQDALQVQPERILMVACHKYDLEAAKAFGFKVAFIPRPLEFGPSSKVDVAPEPWFDVIANDVVDLAGRLGTM